MFLPAALNLQLPLGHPRTFVDQTFVSGFAKATRGLSGWGIGIEDWNNDGWKDILIANGDVQTNTEAYSSRKSKQKNLLLLNNQRGGFQSYWMGEAALHRGAAFGDFDRDGKVDAVITRLNQTPLLLQNVMPTPNHWVTIQLIGHQSNRAGIGARIGVRSGSLTQVDRCMPFGGYASSSDSLVHFGLQDHTSIERIEVEWPSGKYQTLYNQQVDRFIRIEEPTAKN